MHFAFSVFHFTSILFHFIGFFAHHTPNGQTFCQLMRLKNVAIIFAALAECRVIRI